MFHIGVDPISYRSPLPHVEIHTKFRGSRATRRHLRDDPREDVGEDVSVVTRGMRSLCNCMCRRNVRTPQRTAAYSHKHGLNSLFVVVYTGLTPYQRRPSSSTNWQTCSLTSPAAAVSCRSSATRHQLAPRYGPFTPPRIYVRLRA